MKRSIPSPGAMAIGLLLALALQGCHTLSRNGETVAMRSHGDELYRMAPPSVETRWFTFENPQGLKGEGGQARFGRKGAPATAIPAGEALTLVDVEGSGTIRKIWLALGSRQLEEQRGVSIEMYWDHAATPAVQAPAGDFFCHSLGHATPFQSALFASPEGRSHVCFVPMPFRKHARILLRNETEKPVWVYYDVAVTLGEQHDDDMLYFHSTWRRQNPTILREDFTILPKVTGRGRFLGCHIGVRLNPQVSNMWWGEGEVKMYLDGDEEFPTLCGTGTEDYILDAYGQGLFDNLYMGNHYVAPDKSAYGFYRFHIPDPVWFHQDLRVTIQVMSGPGYPAMLEAMAKTPGLRFMKPTDGTEYFTEEELRAHPDRSSVVEREGDDYCATAYFYLDRPENDLPPLADVRERLADLY
ncbi:MAG TPA: DUF2961 domain-containing protein [Candidatus Sumerlaeota bacterium]|nr:DUF2961 domain-containing protein [Candidatus Sumerlaeota bacterium]